MLRPLMIVYSAVAAVFCVGLVLFAEFWISLYGAAPDVQAAVFLRLVGGLMGGLAIVAWFARDAEASPLRDGLLLGLCVANGLATLASVMGALSGVYNPLAWGPVCTYGLFCAAFLVAALAGQCSSSGIHHSAIEANGA